MYTVCIVSQFFEIGSESLEIAFGFWSAILDPQFGISEFCEATQKPPSTECYPNQVTFCILVRHVEFDFFFNLTDQNKPCLSFTTLKKIPGNH